jgi:hypothetical protein
MILEKGGQSKVSKKVGVIPDVDIEPLSFSGNGLRTVHGRRARSEKFLLFMYAMLRQQMSPVDACLLLVWCAVRFR